MHYVDSRRIINKTYFYPYHTLYLNGYNCTSNKRRLVLDSDCPSRDCLRRDRKISVPFDGVTGFIKSHRWRYSAGDRAPFPDATINYTAPCSVSYTLLAPFCTAYFSYPSFPSSLLLLAAIFLSSVFLSVYRSLSNPWPRNDTSSGRGFTRVQRYM